MSSWLLRAIGPTGQLISFERRPDFAAIAKANVVKYFDEAPSWWTLVTADLSAKAALDLLQNGPALRSTHPVLLRAGDPVSAAAPPAALSAPPGPPGPERPSGTEVVSPAAGTAVTGTAAAGTAGEGLFDRVILDMLAPWDCVADVAAALIPGGLICCYVATTTQLSRVTEELRAHGGFFEPAAWETMMRGWHLDGLAVRPEHRMIGHTAFLVTARRLADGVSAPARRRRPSKGAHPEEAPPARGRSSGASL